MSDHDHYDEMFDDLRYLLHWLSIAMFVVGMLQTVYAVTTMTGGRWVTGSLHAGVAVMFYVLWFRTEVRATAYRNALRMRSAQRAKEQA